MLFKIMGMQIVETMKLQSQFRSLFTPESLGETIYYAEVRKLANGIKHNMHGFEIVGNEVEFGKLVFYHKGHTGDCWDYHHTPDAEEEIKIVSGVFRFNDSVILRTGDRRFINANKSYKLECLESGEAFVIVTRINR